MNAKLAPIDYFYNHGDVTMTVYLHFIIPSGIADKPFAVFYIYTRQYKGQT